MVFRECSVGGRVYHGDENTDASMDSDEPLKDTPTAPMRSKASGSRESADAATDTTRVPDPMQAEGAKLPPGVLGHFKDSRLAAELDAAVQGTEDAAWSRSLNGFFSVLALCHTVLASADPVTGALEYKAQSPDEAALVQAAADVGFVFRGRERELLRLQTPFADEPREFELLNILEFTSARKRMSVVVRSLEDGRLFLLTKGADNIIFERLKPGEEDLKRVTTQHLDAFANEGLRTLTLAYKVVSEEYYADWSHRYHEATTLLDEREEKIEEVSDELERDLRLLGATAIEDRLQDGVPETIADLKRAGIKIWVATGDKLETAIAIGHSTNLIQKDSNIVVVRGNGEQGRPVYAQMLRAVEEFFPESDILTDDAVDRSALDDGTERAHPVRVNSGMSEVVGQDNGERPGGFVLVVDGAALTQAFADDVHQYLLLRLAVQCEGVICCRVSPKQKAQITRLVREGLGVMTLAIGDGANDVSMIQAADVGVGISGEEGLQAVNSSDYAIAQFRFLKRLLFVHGHWSYARNGTM
jgi:phospholipid-translocating ATPase